MRHKIFFFLSLALLLSSCGANFERTVFIDGTFTPNGKVQVEGRPINSIKDNYNITLEGPIHINEIGVLRLNFFRMETKKDYWRPRDGFVYFEVGKSELSGNGEYFIPTYYLKNYGNFVYQQRTLSPTEWIQYHPFMSAFILIILAVLTFFIITQIQKNQQILREKEEKETEEKRLREIRDAQLKKEKEIERRKSIVENIANILYKETEKEVNKTLIPTLINELYDIFTGLHSDNMNDLIINGSLTDFQNIINSIKSELTRLKKLALEAQERGYTDEEREYGNSEESNGKMTKEKAFVIFGLKQTATRDETKKSYRDLVKKYNTDQRTNLEEHIKEMLEEKMKELNNAKDYLSNLGLL
jgi:hypothetical protein